MYIKHPHKLFSIRSMTDIFNKKEYPLYDRIYEPDNTNLKLSGFYAFAVVGCPTNPNVQRVFQKSGCAMRIQNFIHNGPTEIRYILPIRKERSIEHALDYIGVLQELYRYSYRDTKVYVKINEVIKTKPSQTLLKPKSIECGIISKNVTNDPKNEYKIVEVQDGWVEVPNGSNIKFYYNVQDYNFIIVSATIANLKQMLMFLTYLRHLYVDTAIEETIHGPVYVPIYNSKTSRIEPSSQIIIKDSTFSFYYNIVDMFFHLKELLPILSNRHCLYLAHIAFGAQLNETFYGDYSPLHIPNKYLYLSKSTVNLMAGTSYANVIASPGQKIFTASYLFRNGYRSELLDLTLTEFVEALKSSTDTQPYNPFEPETVSPVKDRLSYYELRSVLLSKYLFNHKSKHFMSSDIIIKLCLLLLFLQNRKQLIRSVLSNEVVEEEEIVT